MKKHLAFCFLSLCVLSPGLVQGEETNQNEQAIEKEISTLNEATRKSLVQEMLGQLNQSDNQMRNFDQLPPAATAPAPQAHAPEQAFAPETPAVLPQDGTFSLPSEKYRGHGDFLPFESSAAKQSIFIPEQPDNPLLLTVGDLVYFPTPAFKVLHPEERYGIYKLVKYRWLERKPESFLGLEAIGRLKILEVNQSLTIARVITAKDIIRKHDLIYLTEQQ